MKDDLNSALAVLRKGGVIAHATDTCYGFACDIFNDNAIEKVYDLKHMACDKPVSIIVSSFEEACKFGVFNIESEKLARMYWPGALTIIVPRTAALPLYFNPVTSSVGIRVPNHELSLELVSSFGGPLTTTSANITTKPSPYSGEEVLGQFANELIKPDLVLNSGVLQNNPPSTIVDYTGEKFKIIRQGDLRL